MAFRSRAVVVALVGIWGLAALSMLSMLWAKSAGDAFQAGDRAILYAAIATLPFVLPISRRSLAAAGWSITVGISAIGVYVLIRLMIDGTPLFLAGRLNGPVNYRNATALLFALPFWPLVIAMASRAYRRSFRAAALAAASLCLGLAFLTQSRGILIGLAAGGLVALLLGPDRVRRTWVATLAIAGVAAASPILLRPFHAFDGGAGFATRHDIAVAGLGLVVLTGVAFAVGLALALFDNGLRANSAQMRGLRRLGRAGLAIGAVLAVVGALAAAGNPVTYARKKWDEFTSLKSTTPTTTRLLTVGGQRYDLWRVALKEFESAPLFGVGADNYAFGYYRMRRTNRNLNDPHSFVFALLSEEGTAGVILFALFLAGVAAVLARGLPGLSGAERRHVVAPAAAGAVLIGQSSVDWIWLIPGLTAVGMFALAVAAAQAVAGDGGARPASRAPRTARVVRPLALAGLLAAVLAVLALFLSDAYIQRARTLERTPSSELSAAQTASTFDPWSVTPHYLEASAYESVGDRAHAYAQLRDALSLEPQNSATLGVLGDFEARGGHLAFARAYYRRALVFNPLDTGLQQLARIGLTAPARRPRGHRHG